jgi:VWFA-related protein
MARRMRKPLLTASCLLSVAFVAAQERPQQDRPQYVERVEVARVLVDVRALDTRNQPLLGLTPENFQVKIDGKPARLESVQWVTGALLESQASSITLTSAQNAPPAEGRLVVFLFQKSLEPGRIVGFMRMLIELRGFLDGFTKHDRLAVLSFDSRLRLWLDFTSDMERVKTVLARDVLSGKTAPVNESLPPSLFEALQAQRADKTYTMEDSLRVIAGALHPLPGAKTVVIVGHGFGRLTRNGVMMENDYEGARHALQEARASVFCLDVTTADYHSLEEGLRLVAEDTGGFYEQTHLFSQLALDRLGAAIAGHYVLLVEKPEGKRGRHRIDVKLKGRDGRLYARNVFVD